jgi:glutamine amidotransferase
VHWGIRFDLCLVGLKAMSKQVVVIDYGIGNVFSVCNALSYVGASPILSGDPAIIAKAQRVILPGVGAFSRAMENLRERGIADAIKTFIDSGRPFLGICVGMQVLMESSLELGNHAGFGYIKGHVERIPSSIDLRSRVKVPHIGWAKIRSNFDLSRTSTFPSLDIDRYFYFVHSYVCKPSNRENLLATASHHGIEITAMIGCKNVLGVQFHPERSGWNGLCFLKWFVSS